MTAKQVAGNLALGLCVLALALSVQTAQAASQWQLNPEGTGAGGATNLSLLNVGGVGFVQVVPDANDWSAFTFVEHGAYRALQSDMRTPFGAQDLTVAYSVSGRGSFATPLALHFTSGTIDLYTDPVFDFASATPHYGADNGTHLAGFNVFDGGMAATGLVTVQARIAANSLLPGYLFAADSSDLAQRSKVLITLNVFNQPVAPDNLLVSQVVCGLAAYAGPGCNGTPFQNSPLAYTVRDGGYVTITAVPEPEMAGMLLAGLGLIAWAAKRRRSFSH